MLPFNPSSWGPSTKGIPVDIDPPSTLSLGPIIAIDVETDEHDHFVGGAAYDGGKLVYYWTKSSDYIAAIYGKQLVGFNVKGDLNWLKGWGANIVSTQLQDDPMIMSYVVNSNRSSHGLKDLSHDILKWHWPKYKEMVGKGKAKRTLDKQDVEKVAEYCGMDTLATWRLYEHFNKMFTKPQRDLYNNVELPVYRLLWDMECKGIRINTTALDALDAKMGQEAKTARAQLGMYSLAWNPNSPAQTLEILRANGIFVSSTGKPELKKHKHHQLVNDLLDYRKVTKLYTTYVQPMKARNSDIIHTTFNQVAMQGDGKGLGIRTGRLSSNDPNLQNIPAKRTAGDYGSQLRDLFIPRQGKVFIDADYSQIEYRLLAHFSQEPSLVSGFHAGADVHSVTGNLLAPNDPNARSIGKTLNFASIYGAGADKIADTANVTPSQAQAFLDAYWLKLPKVKQWMDRTVMLAKSRGGVSTMSGRFIPLPELKERVFWKRMHAERAAVNYIIQGSAADIIKVAMLELKKNGYESVIQVHDELIFEADPLTAEADLVKIKQIMENVVKLTVPIVADAHIGSTWDAAKG